MIPLGPYTFRLIRIVVYRNFLGVRRLINSQFFSLKAFFFPLSFCKSTQQLFRMQFIAFLSPGLLDLSLWGLQCQERIPGFSLFWKTQIQFESLLKKLSLQQYPKQESIRLLPTCQIPLRYVHDSSNGMCFNVRSNSSNSYLMSEFKGSMVNCFHSQYHSVLLSRYFCIVLNA